MKVNKRTDRTTTKNAGNGKKYLFLVVSLLLDLGGMLTFLLPAIGEIGDLAWAPVAGVASFFMYGGRTGAAGGLFTFVEEILPGTDWVPSLTLTWCYRYLIERPSQKELPPKQK